MSNDLKIEDIKQWKATPGAVIILTVDVSLMPHKRAVDYMKAVADHVKIIFPDNEIMIVPNTVKFEVTLEE